MSDSSNSAIDGAGEDEAASAVGVGKAPLRAASRALIGASLKFTPSAFAYSSAHRRIAAIGFLFQLLP